METKDSFVSIWEELAEIAKRVISERPRFAAIENTLFKYKKQCLFKELQTQPVLCIGQCNLHANQSCLDFITCSKCKLRQIPCSFQNCICHGSGMLIRTTSEQYFRHQIPGESCSILVSSEPNEVNRIIQHYVTYH